MTLDTRIPRRISQAVGSVLLLTMFFLLGSSFLKKSTTDITMGIIMWQIALKILIFLLPMIWFFFFLKKEKMVLPSVAEKAPLNKTLLLTLSSAGLIIITQMLYAALFPDAMQTVGVAKDNTFTENLLLFLLSALIPAIMEEILFRGIILRSMRVFRTSLAILMSAVVFALMHFSAAYFPIAFVSGLILSMAYVSTASLRSVIGIHFLCNAFWFLTETVNVYIPDIRGILMRTAFTVGVLLSSAGLPFLQENMIAFFDDDEYSVPSSAVWTIPMILFLALSTGIQLLV